MEQPGPNVEEPLVLRALGGDRVAFEELVRRTARVTYASLVVHVRDPHVAEDLCQETYLRAWGQLESLEDPVRFRGWLATVARSVLLDHLKAVGRKKRGVAQAMEREPAGGGAGPGEQVSGVEERERAVRALESLPEPYRTAVTLRYLGETGREEISRQLGLTNGSLRGLLGRGLNMLRERLGVEGVKGGRHVE